MRVTPSSLASMTGSKAGWRRVMSGCEMLLILKTGPSIYPALNRFHTILPKIGV